MILQNMMVPVIFLYIINYTRGKNMKIKIFFIIVIGVILLGGFYFWNNPVLLKENTVEVEVNSTFDPYENIRFVVLGNNEDVKVKGEVDVDKPGDYTITYVLRDKSKTANVNVRDTQGPVLKVQNKTVDLHEEIVPELFVSEAKDASEYELSFEKKPDLDTVGKQKLKVVAKDIYGNSTTKKITVNRVKDENPPVLNIVSDFKITQGVAEDIASKITVEDDFDPKPSFELDTSKLDIYTPGTYTVVAKAHDRSGNSIDKAFEIEVLFNPEYAEKVVYLTFDDGPSDNTKEILDILKKYNVKATFFVTGHDQNHRDSIKRAYDEGHSIGLHSYTHDYSNIYSSTEAYFADLQAVSDMVEGITGKKSDIIRFPGGASNTISANYSKGIMSQLVKMVADKGYQYFDWNVSSGDAEGNNIPKDAIIESSCTDSMNHINLLFHDSSPKDTTVEALETIIQYYKEKGYQFHPLTKDSYVVHHGVQN